MLLFSVTNLDLFKVCLYILSETEFRLKDIKTRKYGVAIRKNRKQTYSLLCSSESDLNFCWSINTTLTELFLKGITEVSTFDWHSAVNLEWKIQTFQAKCDQNSLAHTIKDPHQSSIRLSSDSMGITWQRMHFILKSSSRAGTNSCVYSAKNVKLVQKYLVINNS